MGSITFCRDFTVRIHGSTLSPREAIHVALASTGEFKIRKGVEDKDVDGGTEWLDLENRRFAQRRQIRVLLDIFQDSFGLQLDRKIRGLISINC